MDNSSKVDIKIQLNNLHQSLSKDNEQMLMESPSSLNLPPVEDETVSILAISSLSSMVQTFPVEGEISLPDHISSYFTCLHARTAQWMLVPRCHFELDITEIAVH